MSSKYRRAGLRGQFLVLRRRVRFFSRSASKVVTGIAVAHVKLIADDWDTTWDARKKVIARLRSCVEAEDSAGCLVYGGRTNRRGGALRARHAGGYLACCGT